MSELIGDDLSDELWIGALGPTPEGEFTGYDAGKPATWPREDDGPYDGEFWLRYIDRHLRQDPTMEGAMALRARMRRRLQTGNLRAVAVNPETRATHVIAPEKWLASGEAGRWRWWSGLYWAGPEAEDRCDVYIVGDPVPPISPPMDHPGELHPRRKNTLLLLIYGMSLAYYGSDYPALATAIHRDLEAKGIRVSDDTIRDILAEARELHDPASETGRKPGKARKPS